jgi:hypothetical protein
MPKLIAVAALAATLVAVAALPAWADDPIDFAGPGRGNSHGNISVGAGGRSHRGGLGGGGGSGGGSGGAATDPCAGTPAGAICKVLVNNGPGGAPAPVVPPIDIARSLRASAHLPLPGIRMSPPAGADQLVQLPSWLWLDTPWHEVSASVTLGPEFVQITATPVEVAWDLRDGSGAGHVVCDGPGTAYDPGLAPEAQSSDCSYTFHQAAAADRVTAAITWRVTWFATGAIDDFGTLPNQTTSAGATVRVVQAESVNAG